VQFTYDSAPVNTATGTAVTILDGTGQRILHRFVRPGCDHHTLHYRPASTTSGAAPDNLLYLDSTLPLDELGLMWQFSSPIQLPGVGPNGTVSFLNVHASSALGFIVEGAEERVDPAGQAFLSNVPGFTNVTIGAANINALAPLYSACQAPIYGFNHVENEPQPTVFNSFKMYNYSFFITDGATYAIPTNLTLTANIQFATQRDQLNNFYQTI
jgi:hypothetical protein